MRINLQPCGTSWATSPTFTQNHRYCVVGGGAFDAPAVAGFGSLTGFGECVKFVGEVPFDYIKCFDGGQEGYIGEDRDKKGTYTPIRYSTNRSTRSKLQPWGNRKRPMRCFANVLCIALLAQGES